MILLASACSLIPQVVKAQADQGIFRSSEDYTIKCARAEGFEVGNEFQHFTHVQTRPIHHVKHISWRFWSHCKSFPKWKVTCNFKFPKMASFWTNFNSTFQHQRSFKWNFVQHEKLNIFLSHFQKVQEHEKPMYGCQVMAQWISEMTHNQDGITSTWIVQIGSSLYAQTPFDMYFHGA